MTDTPTAVQPTLLPPTAPTFKTERVRPDELPPNELLDGPPPSKELIESIRSYGVVDPIVIRKVDGFDFPYVVISGSRRVKAVRLLLAEAAVPSGEEKDKSVDVPAVAHLRRIPARLVDSLGDAPADVLVVQANTLRSRNKAAEYKAVKRLLDAGADEKAVSRATGLTHAQIRELLRLDSLNTVLLEAASEGKITGTQAHDIARLPQESQERLVEVFSDKGKITAMDVHVERQARQDTAATAMDWGAVDAVPALPLPDVSAAPDQAAVIALVAQSLVEAVRGADSSTWQGDFEVDGQRWVVSVGRVSGDTVDPL